PPPPLFITLSLHDALPISLERVEELVALLEVVDRFGHGGDEVLEAGLARGLLAHQHLRHRADELRQVLLDRRQLLGFELQLGVRDRKSTRLNSSHLGISYA